MSSPKKPQFLILLLLVTFGSVGAVLFTPALPAIQKFFQISVGHAQLTMTFYLLGYATGQLPYGPLANGIGRKKTLYVGISLSILGSLLCALSSSIGSFGVLVFARFLQAFGATVGLKMSYTMVADTHEPAEATRMISRFTLAFAVIPGFGVAIGGLLTDWIHWESCFYFLALFGALMLFLSTRLPETAPLIHRDHLKLSAILEGYLLKLKNRRLILCSFMMGCGGAIIYIFASKAPFIGISLMGIEPDIFGLYSLIPSLGMILGSFLSSSLIGRFSQPNLILSSTLAAILGTLSMLIPFAFSEPTTLSLFLPMVVIYLFQSVSFANVASYGLSTAKNKSNASAIFNFINISTIVLSVLLAEYIFPESAPALPLFFLLFLTIAAFLALQLRKLAITT